MIGLSLSVQDIQEVQNAIKKEIEKLGTDKFVLVGIHEEDNGRDDTSITNAQLGATLHFGAEINHPGGTAYGYATQKDAEAGKVRFLKKGQGFMELGVTGPHQIKIPARPWLDVGVASGNEEYAAIIEAGVKDGLDADTIMEQVGNMAAAKAQEYMTELQSPPNAPSTIRQKGSSNPLINTGALRQSVTYSVTDNTPKEGL